MENLIIRFLKISIFSPKILKTCCRALFIYINLIDYLVATNCEENSSSSTFLNEYLKYRLFSRKKASYRLRRDETPLLKKKIIFFLLFNFSIVC
jgi:hypothetical protein